MKLLILSGRSGSGKSIALGALEDLGFPASITCPPACLRHFLRKEAEQRPGDFAVSIDARSLPANSRALARGWPFFARPIPPYPLKFSISMRRL